MPQNYYHVYINNGYEKFTVPELASLLSIPSDVRISEYSNEGPYAKIWSARLSSGLLGLTNCRSGNRGPKSYNEVLLAVGDDGLNKLVDLGFITCPVCLPERIDGFWEAVEDTVMHKYGIKYGINSLDDYTNREILPFDARRVDWKEILPITGNTPNRLYVPKGLSENEVAEFQRRFIGIGFVLPPTGYYDPDAPGRFTEYQLPTAGR